MPGHNYVFDRLVENSKVDDIVALHQKIFSGLLIGQLGGAFTSLFYRKIQQSAAGVIFVCKHQGRVVGFIAGLSDGPYISSDLFRSALTGFVKNMFRDFSVVLNVVRYILRKFYFHPGSFNAELLSIAVLEDYQGQGIGKRLVKMLDDFMREKGVQRYKVFTDTRFSTGYRLYESLNFKLEKGADILGLGIKLYCREL